MSQVLINKINSYPNFNYDKCSNSIFNCKNHSNWIDDLLNISYELDSSGFDYKLDKNSNFINVKKR